MKYGELMVALRRGPLPHVFLLAGEEHYYIEKARERLLQLLFPDPGALQDGLQKFTGDVDLDTLLGTLDPAGDHYRAVVSAAAYLQSLIDGDTATQADVTSAMTALTRAMAGIF